MQLSEIRTLAFNWPIREGITDSDTFVKQPSNWPEHHCEKKLC